MPATNALLKAILAIIDKLRSLTIPQPNTTAAQTYQFVNLAPLESNADPLNPGLAELFEFATENMKADLATIDLAIKNGQIPDPATVINLSTPLHDAWASFQVLNYLLYLSAYLGYPAPAAQFFAPVIPNLSAQLNPAPILVPQPSPPIAPPITPPTPTPTPSPPPPSPPPPVPSPPVPPPPAPPPTPTPPPSPPPSPPITVRLKVGKMNDYTGSGEPNNGAEVQSLTGVKIISIPVNALIPSQTSVTIDWWTQINNPSIVGGTIDQITHTYQAAGIKVILELVCDCADGTPRSQFFPTDAVTFLTNLQSLAVTLAQNAARLNCVAISIAPQLFPWQNSGDSPAAYMTQWNNLYAACKAVFPLPILYIADPKNVGPKDATSAMDWTTSWDAIGVKISPPIGTNVTATNIRNYWHTVNDTEATAYAAPLFGASGWLATLSAAWVSGGKQLYIETGFSAIAG